ncbi:MAG: DUF1015 domain-containing protein [Flavobacteriales bacterium]|nr:DUF1015 domain-containing protein [Flavobacteriales bacterium]
MIALRPFRAWRPAPDKAHLVGSRTYVSYSEAELADRLAGNPWTFLHVIHPPGLGDATRAERFAAVRAAFHDFVHRGVMVRDAKPTLYVYEQQHRGNVSRGIIAGVSVRDYREGRIRVHEQTLTAREYLFAEYLASTGINAEPVLLCTPAGIAWEALLDPLLNIRPDVDFSTTDRVRHRLWTVHDPALEQALHKTFAEVPALYIADGHHRMASSARLSEAHDADENDPRAWCLAFIVPKPQLYIYNFDRTVADLGGLSEADFLDRLRQAGDPIPMAAPWTEPGLVAVRTPGGWHGLRLTPPPADAAPDARLDAARLSELVLGPILGIQDLRTDPRVGFVPGTQGTSALEHMVEAGEAAVAFHLHAVSFAELQAVADHGGTMPPKSTWIEPKLRSGLLVYDLDPKG